MKFLFVTGGVPSLIGQNHILDLLNALTGEYESTVVCFDLGEPHLAHSDGELSRNARVIRVPFARKSRLTRVVRSFITRDPVAVQGFRSVAMQDAITRAMAETKYDLVIFEQLVMGQYAELASGTAALLFPVDAVSRFKRQRSRNASSAVRKIAFAVDRWMTRAYEKTLYPHFDGVLFVSNADAEYTIRNHQADWSRVFVLPLAVDTEYFHPRTTCGPAAPSLVFLGNMFNAISEDAVQWFYRAVWHQLKRTVPELKLYIAGNQPSDRVQALAKQDPNIIVTGFLEDVRPPIWDATVFISPLRMGTGVKNRFLQAMAMGKAIVASPLTIEGTGVTPGVEAMVAESAEDWVTQCAQLLQQPSERKLLGQKAREYIEKNHTPVAKAARFLAIARQVIGQRRRVSSLLHFRNAAPSGILAATRRTLEPRATKRG
jgi:glycosyltransferase involved in cell wall biosynthesis